MSQNIIILDNYAFYFQQFVSSLLKILKSNQQMGVNEKLFKNVHSLRMFSYRGGKLV